MTAPDRIWAFYAPEIAENEAGATIVAHENTQHGAKEYVRIDLHDATKAQLAKALAALRWLDKNPKAWPDDRRIFVCAALAEIEKGGV